MAGLAAVHEADAVHVDLANAEIDALDAVEQAGHLTGGEADHAVVEIGLELLTEVGDEAVGRGFFDAEFGLALLGA